MLLRARLVVASALGLSFAGALVSVGIGGCCRRCPLVELPPSLPTGPVARQRRLVTIAVMGGGDTPVIEALDRTLTANGIEWSGDGGVWWGVEVRAEDEERARALIRAAREPAFTERSFHSPDVQR